MKPYWQDNSGVLYQGDVLAVLKELPAESVDCCVTSPPYWGLRDYGVAGQLGIEKTPEEYVAKMVEVFREVRRVLKKDGTLWLNLGDTYSAARWSSGKGQPMNKNKDVYRSGKETEERLSNLPDKNLVGIPWRVAFALQADGWYLRQDIIWAKRSVMPESVTDRCTKSHEYIFLMTKSPKYYFDNEAIKEPAEYGGTEEKIERARDNGKSMPTAIKAGIRPRDKRAGQGRIAYGGGKRTGADGQGQEAFVSIPEKRNKRDVWFISTQPFPDAHFATFPPDLIIPMIKAGTKEKGIVLDPFMGSGTTAAVAKDLGRRYVGIDLNPKYLDMSVKRLRQEVLFRPAPAGKEM